MSSSSFVLSFIGSGWLRVLAAYEHAKRSFRMSSLWQHMKQPNVRQQQHNSRWMPHTNKLATDRTHERNAIAHIRMLNIDNCLCAGFSRLCCEWDAADLNIECWITERGVNAAVASIPCQWQTKAHVCAYDLIVLAGNTKRFMFTVGLRHDRCILQLYFVQQAEMYAHIAIELVKVVWLITARFMCPLARWSSLEFGWISNINRTSFAANFVVCVWQCWLAHLYVFQASILSVQTIYRYVRDR